MNILFVCSMNQWRSPTAEAVFKDTPRLSVRSAGVSQAAKHTINQKDIAWADHIFVMENGHKDRIIEKFARVTLPPIHVLDITDDYVFMNSDLVEIFNTELRAQIEELLNREK